MKRILLMSLILSFLPMAQAETRNQVLDFKGIDTLEIRADTASATVVVAEKYTLTATTTGKTRYSVVKKGKTLLLEGISPNTCMVCKLELNLKIPKGLMVKVKFGTGDFNLFGAMKSLDAQTDTGNLVICNSDLALLNLKVGTGKIASFNSKGNITARADTGDIQIENSRGSLKLASGTGEISVHLAQNTLDASVETGSITLEELIFPKGSKNRAKTGTGEIKAIKLNQTGLSVIGSSETGEISIAAKYTTQLEGKTPVAWLELITGTGSISAQ